MEFNFVPSLVHLASVKVISNLLQNREIGKMLNDDMKRLNRPRFFRIKKRDLWESIKEKISEKLPVLPPFLSKEVAKIILPMHDAVVAWLKDHDSTRSSQWTDVDYSLFCWKSNGMIDREQTARKIVRNENFDISHRFSIACTYFFKDEILSLWGTMQESGINFSEKQINSAVSVWMKLLKEENTKSMEELIEHYFNPSLVARSKFQYFHVSPLPRVLLRLSSYFHLLPLEYRKGYFINDGFGVHVDDFYLCLLQMNETEIFELFRAKPAYVLRKFLKWPFQSVFMKLATEIVRDMVLTDFEDIFDSICYSFILQGYDYFELFKEFWNIIPDNYKNEIKRNEDRFEICEKILNCDNKNVVSQVIESTQRFVCY